MQERLTCGSLAETGSFFLNAGNVSSSYAGKALSSIARKASSFYAGKTLSSIARKAASSYAGKAPSLMLKGSLSQ